jgi:hypothetical protein
MISLKTTTLSARAPTSAHLPPSASKRRETRCRSQCFIRERTTWQAVWKKETLKSQAELFLTPSSDLWLGLKPDGVYSALERDGIVTAASK